MKLLVALHGKPGTGEDWDALFEALSLDDSWETVAPTRPKAGTPLDVFTEVLDTMLDAADAERTVVVGYSWGCYLAMQHLLRGERAPDSVVLINPYLVAESSISAPVNALLAVPCLGSWLLARSAADRAEKLLQNSYAPDPVPPSARAHRERLSDPQLWRGAVQATNLHNAMPLPELAALKVPVLAIVGDADQVASWTEHRASLHPDDPRLVEHTIAGAGHALPWTHTAALAEQIEQWLDPEKHD